MMLSNTSFPRWLILLIDIVIIIISVFLAYMVRFNFKIPQIAIVQIPEILGYILGVRIISFLVSRTYAGIVRYTSTEDVVRIFIVIIAGSIFFIITNLVTYYTINEKFFIPFSIIIIDFFATTLGMSFYRILVKVALLELQTSSKNKTSVVIFGAGESGIVSKGALDRDAGTKYKVLAFIDDNEKKVGKKLENIPIVNGSELEKTLKNNNVAHLILSVQNLSPARKKEIIETCLENNTRVLNVPPMNKWINGELSFKQIKKINIEDLLERDEIKLDQEKIKNELSGRNVLITGAAGSIGSELVRQIANYSPKNIILVDNAETPLYQVELELAEHPMGVSNEIILCDIRNKTRMKLIFERFKPEIIFHAAAYKHVPMMENNPTEAMLNNIEGTKVVADLAVDFNIEKFIMISTDKAVNPTSVMGASKRIAEIYTQSLNKKSNTKFITTRFGNVLGSNGSVIPLFAKQIEQGGPVKITHPKVTRYFMTIPEACQLVLEAGSMGLGGEIYIFDMGKSVKIVDLAKKMIKLSRLTLGKDIQIIYTGLRPGEKLYEELLNNEENTIQTHHSQIMIGKVKEYDPEVVKKEIDKLLQ
ncbi:MAG: polysaccharide biosynthesis protein, partial [Bacteroidetes bacterium]|nr:polysaccharide biosynthesis protein [Bacteroidota bacterium]